MNLRETLVVIVAFLSAAAARADQRIEYNRDIRPILAENCFACHGPDSASRKAGLRLDKRDAAIQAEVLVPGKPAESEIVRRIFADKPREQMPPPSSRKKLTDAQKDMLRRWIASGAEYQLHWSYTAPQKPALPAVKNMSWVRNPIDAFILARLEGLHMQPGPEADRRTLIRRLSLDLTGLPPTPADVEEFFKDTRPNAYEELVDRILKSPRWGEHRARYWLDAARYADTHGLHFDNFREMWSYRDWVIDAFNRNLPFDQFTLEQLAGDLLPNRTLDQLVATGFNRCNITTNEGGTILEENLVLYTKDRTETVAQVWLGLTANCSVCHDHKYDSFTQRDFYSLAAFFNNSTQGALDGNIRDTPPIIFVPRREDRAQWEGLAKKIDLLKNDLKARQQAARKDFQNWLTKAMPGDLAALLPTAGLQMHAPFTEGTGKVEITANGTTRLVPLPSGYEWKPGKLAAKGLALKPGAALAVADAGNFEKDQGFTVSAWVNGSRRGLLGAIVARMDTPANKYRGWDLWVENDKVGMHIVHAWPDDALKVTTRATLKKGQWQQVTVSYDGSGKAAGVRIYLDGVLQPVDVFTDKLRQSIKTAVPLKIGQRHEGDRLAGAWIQDLRLYARPLSAGDVQTLAQTPVAQGVLRKPAGKRTAKEVQELFTWWLGALDQPGRDLQSSLARLTEEEVALKSRGTIAHVMQEKPEEPTAYVLFRGEYDKRRDKVKARTPAILPPMPADQPNNRLGFARWLLRPEHPLTARVTVNRFWQEVFGTGIVRTTGDFGVSGELPSHPELLDWLAVDFRESGWDIKRFFKQIVTSATYRQSAAVTKEKLEKDPHNIYLARAPRYRLDAEMMRDYALAVSELLSPRIGGPSVKPYQPVGVWEAVAMIGSNTRDYRADTGDKLYRRSMYTFWKRGAPPASMDILNAPSREFCVVRRERTNTPLQALVTLNDPQLIEAARVLAQRTLKEAGPKLEDRLDFIFTRLLARPAREKEVAIVRTSVNDLLAHYRAHPQDAAKLLVVGEAPRDATLDAPTLAAWTMVCNELMNLDEVLNK